MAVEMMSKTVEAYQQSNEMLAKIHESLKDNTSAATQAVLERLEVHETQAAYREQALLEAVKSNAETSREILRALQYISKFSEISSTKLGNMELRQTELAGEGTDCARMLDMYSRGSSAVCSE